MSLQCESARGCRNLAAVSVTVLAPTGETITTDTGTDSVLAPVISARLCDDCGVMADAHAVWMVELTGGHVDTVSLDPAEVLELDPISLAKADRERVPA